jgi:hypothetical protein
MKEMQNWLKENLTEVWVEEVWLPSSPDCKTASLLTILYGASLN